MTASKRAKPGGRRTAPAAARNLTERDQGIIPADTLHMLPDLVTALGGDPVKLCIDAGLDPALVDPDCRVMPTRAAARLLELAQHRFACPDLGLRLAQCQRTDRKRNLFELVMRNSPNLLEAFTWSARHCRTYSGSVGMILERGPQRGRAFMRIEFDARGSGGDRILLELMLLRMFHITGDITGGRACPGEVWFEHEPGAAAAVYHRHFGGMVRFGQRASGFFLDAADLETPIVDADPQLLELATFFIENRFPEPSRPARVQVRSLIARLLQAGEPCGGEDIATRLGLHCRTMQRRLHEEGTSFEEIKDEVRRDFALRGLTQQNISLSRLAEKLGYSEVSALSRSCQRWFDASPSRLRKDRAKDRAVELA